MRVVLEGVHHFVGYYAEEFVFEEGVGIVFISGRGHDVFDVSDVEVHFFVGGIEVCAGCVGYAVHGADD